MLHVCINTNIILYIFQSVLYTIATCCYYLLFIQFEVGCIVFLTCLLPRIHVHWTECLSSYYTCVMDDSHKSCKSIFQSFIYNNNTSLVKNCQSHEIQVLCDHFGFFLFLYLLICIICLTFSFQKVFLE